MGIESDRLKEARERLYDTAIEAADALGIPRGTYAQYENGRRSFHKHARKLAARLKVPVGWLMGDRGEKMGEATNDPSIELSEEGKRQLAAYAEFLKSQEKTKP